MCMIWDMGSGEVELSTWVKDREVEWPQAVRPEDARRLPHEAPRLQIVTETPRPRSGALPVEVAHGDIEAFIDSFNSQ